MSAAFYKNDHTPLCVNHLDNGYLAEQNIFNGNFLNLFPEQSNEIYRRCFNYLATCKLSSRCVRVFCAIMEQTVGFRKLEDNITSTRLEGLTKIRRDHAAQAMRELNQHNVIIHRCGGQYYNYVSINFNLESWGAGQNNTQARSNDPRLLISDHYEGQPIDQGLDLNDSYQPEVSAENVDIPNIPIDQGHRLDNIDPKTNNKKMSEDNQPLQQEKIIEDNQASQPEKKLKDNQPLKQEKNPENNPLIDKEDLTLQIQNAVTSALNDVTENLTHQLQSFAGQLHTIEEKFQKIQTIASTDTQPDHNPQNQQSANSAIANAVSNAVSNNDFSYEFPIQLSEQQCQELERSLLPRAGDYSQALLNTLANRMQNTTDPLKNPMAYISSLVSKLEAGTLDLQAFSSNAELAERMGLTSIQSDQATIEQLQAEEHERLQQQIDQLTQDYLAEYESYKPTHKQIETEMSQTGLSYWQIADKLDLTAIVKPIVNKLNRLVEETKTLETKQKELAL